MPIPVTLLGELCDILLGVWLHHSVVEVPSGSLVALDNIEWYLNGKNR